MNIFPLERMPERAARFQIDAHVIKMPVESLQMLCTAARTAGVEPEKIPYKSTHINHPCVQWVLADKSHAAWLHSHYLHLGAEFKVRFGHVHGCNTDDMRLRIGYMVNDLKRRLGDSLYDTPQHFPLVVPEWYKVDMDEDRVVQAIHSYRNYYYNEKRQMSLRWKSGDTNGYARKLAGPPVFINTYDSISRETTGVILNLPGQPPRRIVLGGSRYGQDLSYDIREIVVSDVGGRQVLQYKDRYGRVHGGPDA